MFDIHLTLATGAHLTQERRVHTGPVDPASRTYIAQTKSPSVTPQPSIASTHTETQQAKEKPATNENEGTLSVTASKAGADIFVDSTGRGKAPTSFTLKPGKHSLQVVLDGYQDWVQEISMEAGETTNVTANLRPVTTTLATQSANTPSARRNDMVVKSYIESPASSAQQNFAPSQTKNEDKPLPAATSSAV